MEPLYFPPNEDHPSVRLQLMARPPIPPELWRDRRRYEAAQVLGRALVEVADWPVDRFIPEDPLSVILPPMSSLDAVELAMNLEELTYRDLPHAVTALLSVEPDSIRTLTFGRLVDLMLEK